jgi:hypothetical protein
MHRGDKMVLREALKGPVNAKTKAAFLAQQAAPGQAILTA